jgi:predicted nuclease with TOPRIM domain
MISVFSILTCRSVYGVSEMLRAKRMDKAFQIVEDINTLLDETDKLKEKWYESKDSIESAKQMGITAQGYIDSMEAT